MFTFLTPPNNNWYQETVSNQYHRNKAFTEKDKKSIDNLIGNVVNKELHDLDMTQAIVDAI